MRPILRKISIGAMVSVAVGTMTFGTLAGTASARPNGHCGQTFDPTTDGATAHWTLDCSGGQITVKGWYQDDELDGDCVGVKAHFADGSTKRSETCDGWGSKKSFKWTRPGSIADVYLYEF
ncbi:hypothetical protein CP981_04215 [Streptomyces platensis]|uniref:Uncharacterized protein n=2 Tax=Streptomyces platensis TaxID=58346 RepID=A0AAE6TKY9_STRPT|nr:hypothetical protein BG653_01480 [Streptomyces platensis]QEV50987.1 hypothetical protein CP981_04215 [Streptomyces platensis]